MRHQINRQFLISRQFLIFIHLWSSQFDRIYCYLIRSIYLIDIQNELVYFLLCSLLVIHVCVCVQAERTIQTFDPLSGIQSTSIVYLCTINISAERASNRNKIKKTQNLYNFYLFSYRFVLCVRDIQAKMKQFSSGQKLSYTNWSK